jgi:hypothetical protein
MSPDAFSLSRAIHCLNFVSSYGYKGPDPIKKFLLSNKELFKGQPLCTKDFSRCSMALFCVLELDRHDIFYWLLEQGATIAGKEELDLITIILHSKHFSKAFSFIK